jgi:hypothetical protein
MLLIGLILRASVSIPQEPINIIIACTEKITGPKSLAKISFKPSAQDIIQTLTTRS